MALHARCGLWMGCLRGLRALLFERVERDGFKLGALPSTS